jgi:F420-0:gamma-glutamyl ligase-like protein
MAVTTQYWKPGEDYITEIVKAIENKVKDEDFVTISEKAISAALGQIIDENAVQPSKFARFLAKYWMRFFWPYILGPLCHLRKKTIRHLRSYPIKEGSAHKQLVLDHGGFLQALMQGSEGAIDGSNLPYSYVSLPLKNPKQIAGKIQRQIISRLDKRVTVAIVDTDKTYSLKGFHFTPRPTPIKGIHSFGGALAYVIGRFFKLEKRATPLAIVGSKITTEEAIEIAKIANRSRGSGAGRTVWSMAKAFKTPLTGVAWEMLEKVKHQPVVIIRLKDE